MKKFLFVLLFIALGSRSEGNGPVCETQACKDAAEELMANIDETIKPCENFYHFACNGYINKHLKEKSTLDVVAPLSTMDGVLHTMALDYVEAIDVDKAEYDAVKKMKTYYDTCIEAQDKKMEPFYLKQLQNELKMYGLWPEESENINSFDLEKMLAHMHILGATHIFTVETDTLPKTKYRIVGKIRPKVPTEYYMYYAMKLMALLNISNSQTIAGWALELQSMLRPLERSVVMKEPYNHLKLNERFPQLNWTRFLGDIFTLSGYTDRDIDTFTVAVVNDNYLDQMFSTLKQINPKSLKSYLLVNLIFYWSHSFSNKARLGLADVKIDNKKFRPNFKPPKYECMKELIQSFEAPLLAQYVHTHFPKEKKNEIEGYLKRIVKDFRNKIEHLEWMDDKTKGMVTAKLDNTTFIVGYPENFFKEMEQQFSTVDIIKGNHFNNIYEAKKYSVRRLFLTLHGAPNYMMIWDYSPMIINAYNLRNPNIIKIHVGIINRPLFDMERPKYLNYGGIGMLLGHEVTHGYDNYGITYKVHNTSTFTWPPLMAAKFTERAKCIKEQYQNYVFEDLNMPLSWKKSYGLHDDISDVMGLQRSYSAYEEYVKENGEEPQLSGTKYTNRQLFFLQFAQIFCTAYKSPWNTASVESSTYSPGEFRVIGPIVNHPDFGKIFNCSVGSPMNPEKKCELYM